MAEIERTIPPDRFIVSKTDLKGIITYCNEIFMEIVGAREEDLLGKPHSIVRHPDMPKTVFKLLWDHLHQKKEIFAFVKNKCFDDAYYWVFANVSPSYDANGNVIGYYSVRRQMHNSLKEPISKLYKDILKAEEIGGIEGGERFLNSILNDMNLTYDEYIMKLVREQG